ncbi:MAG: hypothetical protein IAF38_05525 [Bacteroidia bacterium]|nr:hypothetical protein [Bacteroidia bacterium]
MKKLLFFTGILLLTCITFFFPLGGSRNPLVKGNFEIAKKKGKSGTDYTYYKKGKNKIGFTTTRPDRKDSSILICIPAAFTRLTDFRVDGFYCENGVAGNTDSINHHIGGAMKIKGDSVWIFATNKGKFFTKGMIDTLKNEKATAFQQIQMIKNFVAEDSKSEKKFQSRGIAVMFDGEVCIVESEQAITLKTFAQDLAGEDNVKELLYTDMGAWDEGWYRDPITKKIRVMGKNLSQTSKQSNWVYIKKP